jgi:hypothetical protein
MDNIWTQSALGKANNKMFDNFKYLWGARFANGHIITQHPKDLYSKHNPESAYNPSSFRDFLDYAENTQTFRWWNFVYLTKKNHSQ